MNYYDAIETKDVLGEKLPTKALGDIALPSTMSPTMCGVIKSYVNAHFDNIA